MAGVLRSCRLGIRLPWLLGRILGRSGLARVRLHWLLTLILRRKGLGCVGRCWRLGLIRVPGLNGATVLSGVNELNRLDLTTEVAGVNRMDLS
jgi:hypothetical protein